MLTITNQPTYNWM